MDNNFLFFDIETKGDVNLAEGTGLFNEEPEPF